MNIFFFNVPSVFSQRGEIDVSTSKLQELQSAIGKSEADLTQAQEMREKEHQEHQNAHGELGEATEMSGRAIKTLSAKVGRCAKREGERCWLDSLWSSVRVSQISYCHKLS